MTNDTMKGIVGVHPTVNMLAAVPINFGEEEGPAFLVVGGRETFRQMLHDLASTGVRMAIIVEMGEVHAAYEEQFTVGDKIFYQEGAAIQIGDRIIMPLNAPLGYKKAEEED
jgi:hypothetical protein